jgi:hypothetical protein
MLTFILSMRARALSKDWAYHTWLLDRTLNSIVAQTNREFDVVVVCHDIPDCRVKDPAIHFLSVDFPHPKHEFSDMLVDKVLKVSRGVEWAQARGADHVMFVDADDLVSRRLSGFVAAREDGDGWLFHEGYAHRYGTGWLQKHTPHHLICGTGAIVRLSRLRFADDPQYRGERVNTLAAAGHAKYEEVMAEEGAVLEPLPFPGAVYILHDDSTCDAPQNIFRAPGAFAPRPTWRRALSWAKRAGGRALARRAITPWLRAEFGIPATDYQPHP